MSEHDHPAQRQDHSGRPARAVVSNHTITVPPESSMVALLGPRDELLRTVERAFPTVSIHVRGNEFHLKGEPSDMALVEDLIDELMTIVDTGQPVTSDAVERAIGMLRGQSRERPADVLTMNIVSSRGRTIRPKTLGQKQYVDAIDRNTIVFGIGPAGTGKTYLAMAKAVAALQAKEVGRIILTRPAVEAGERLGFLPGTLNDKIDPYLRPLYDALHDMVDPDSIPRLMEAGTIEVAPLAYMRGRAQPLGATVMTPDGPTSIGSLAVGDLVTGSDGRPTPVIGVFPQGRKEIFRLSTQDGASTLCCGEHLWTVRDKRRGRHRVVQTHEMVGRLRAAHAHRFELPLVDPVQMPHRPVPMDAYALGRLLGDGCTTTSTATKDPELGAGLDGLDALRTTSDNDRGGGRGGLAVAHPVTDVIRRLRLAGTRSDTQFVPDAYLINSTEVRLAMLQGLLDSDGGAVGHEGHTCRVHYATTSSRLRDDVVYLVRSLGGVAYTRTRPAEGRPGTARGRFAGPGHDAYVLDIRLPQGIAPFRLERKRQRYASSPAARPVRFVDSIESAGEAETVCIQVAAEDSLYVTDDLLVTHNTLNDSFVVLDEAQNTSAEQMKMFLTRLGFGSKMVVTGDVTQVDLPGGTRSGLRVVQDILGGVDDVQFSYLDASDVVRHRLVSAIVEAYGAYDAREGDRGGVRRASGHGRREPS